MNAAPACARVSWVAWLARGLAAACLLLAAAGGSARADGTFQHVVREGETLASIARLYYGDPKREGVLVAENGLGSLGGTNVTAGMRLVVPWTHYHRVREGETWATIAERYYGEASRAFVLLDANKASRRGQPAVGAELLIPYPLRVVADQNDTVQSIAAAFLGGSSKKNVSMLMRFGRAKKGKLVRGQVVLVPMGDLTLSEEGKRAIEVQSGRIVEGGDVRAVQQWAEERIPEALAHERAGEYPECVALASRLLGTGKLAATQVVTLQRVLGSAYVALGRPQLAAEAFREALRLQPDLELSRIETSPKVLRAFEAGKELLAREPKEPDPPAAPAADAE